MVSGGEDFVVYDAKTGDDLTHAVLTQIIVEQESRAGRAHPASHPLPAPAHPLLRRQHRAPWCRATCSSASRPLAKEQEKFRTMFASAFPTPRLGLRGLPGPGAQEPGDVRAGDEHVDLVRRRQGERRKRRRNGLCGECRRWCAESARPLKGGAEIDELKAQLTAMQERIERLAKDR